MSLINKMNVGNTDYDIQDRLMPDAIGQAGQVLKVKDDGSGLEFSTIESGGKLYRHLLSYSYSDDDYNEYVYNICVYSSRSTEYNSFGKDENDENALFYSQRQLTKIGNRLCLLGQGNSIESIPVYNGYTSQTKDYAIGFLDKYGNDYIITKNGIVQNNVAPSTIKKDSLVFSDIVTEV